MLSKYRGRNITKNEWFYVWAETEPTADPSNPSDEIDLNSIVIVDYGDSATEVPGSLSFLGDDLSFSSHVSQYGSGMHMLTAEAETTDDQFYTLFSLPIDDNSLCWFKTDVIGKEVGSDSSRYERYKGAVLRENGSDTEVVQGFLSKRRLEGEGNKYDVRCRVLGTNLLVEINGESSQTVRWAGTLMYQKVLTGGTIE